MVNAMLTQKQLPCHKKRQKTSPATSSSTSNVIYPIPRPGEPRSNPWTLQDGSPSLQQNTTAWPPPQHRRFYIYPSSNVWWLRSCWERPPLPAKKKAVIQRENILASRVNSRNNIHPLQVQRSPTQSMSVNVFQVPSHSQLISNMSTGLGPFITAFPVVRQIDVNERVIWLQGCGYGLTTMKCIQSRILMQGIKEWIQVCKKGFLVRQSRRAKWIRPSHQTCLNDLECVQTS